MSKDRANIRIEATLALEGRVSGVRDVAAGRATALAAMGIATVRDLVTHYPRRYIDMSQVRTIATASLNQPCTVVGEVYEVKSKRPKRVLVTEVTIVDGTGTMIATFFQQPWLADKLQAGQRMAVSGTMEFGYGFKRMTSPFMEPVEPGVDAQSGLIVAVHPATAKLSTTWVRKLVGNALELVVAAEDPLPLALRTRYRLMPRAAALRNIHFPETMPDAQAARRRLTYEEVLLLQLHLMRSGMGEQGPARGMAHAVDGAAVHALPAALPFDLTDEQATARDQILHQMASSNPAHHMLLGDVGTGKTAVAAFALAAVADTGTQALMMAPTEVLATQYAASLGAPLSSVGVSWGLLTSSTPAAERASLLEGLANGSLQVLFGTHALLEPDVVPRACTLVVIDEQQRFGVEQRAALVAKGAPPAALGATEGFAPDVLSLTATPIPRSLALALFGNMTQSYLKKRPAATAPTTTRVLDYSQRGEAYELAREALEQGRQVYVVCPLVGQPRQAPAAQDDEAADSEDAYDYEGIRFEEEADLESAEQDHRAAVREAEYLATKIFPGFTVDVLHGKLASDQKARVMQRFRDCQVQVLVATTVIEVGVDVPNATVMIVEDADCFGLSQLHQLRGRVGRGSHPGQVFLVSGSKAPTALERLAAMESTDDGFKLAEFDLSLRREGDILGNRQHGASVLKLVNVVRDAAIIEAAHADARAILDADPTLSEPQHRALRYELSRTFERADKNKPGAQGRPKGKG